MTGTAKTEEVVEKTYKLETTIVPTNRVRARQDWADQVYKTEAAMAGRANETADPQERPAGPRGHHISGEERTAELPAG